MEIFRKTKFKTQKLKATINKDKNSQLKNLVNYYKCPKIKQIIKNQTTSLQLGKFLSTN